MLAYFDQKLYVWEVMVHYILVITTSYVVLDLTDRLLQSYSSGFILHLFSIRTFFSQNLLFLKAFSGVLENCIFTPWCEMAFLQHYNGTLPENSHASRIFSSDFGIGFLGRLVIFRDFQKKTHRSSVSACECIYTICMLIFCYYTW